MKTFLHPGCLGDIVYSLPAIKKAGGGVVYLGNRPDVCKEMTPDRFRSIKALLTAQPYISAVMPYEGQPVDIDFTDFRKTYQPRVTLLETQWRWAHKFGAPDLKSAWLTAGKFEHHGRPVIARTPRWQNPAWDQIWPLILDEYPDPIFIGGPEEHAAFCEKFGPVEYRETRDLLDVAKLIAGSSVFIGNQSSPYAIAEGLKHPAILEAYVNPNGRGFGEDCRFPDRPGLRYIAKMRDWERLHKPSRFMLALQFWDGDFDQARALLDLICDIEPVMRRDVELALIARHDLPQSKLDLMQWIWKRKFEAVHVIRSKRHGVGWPSGCNDLWQDGMRQLAALKRAGKTQADGVLTFEADCLPLRPDWINVLKAEWKKAKARGKICTGHAHNEPNTHVNGNAIFAIDIVERYPQLQTSRTGAGWDVEHGKLLLQYGLDSQEIYQLYRIKEIDRATLEGIKKNGKRPAFFHGIKCEDGIEIIREKVADGTFAIDAEPYAVKTAAS